MSLFLLSVVDVVMILAMERLLNEIVYAINLFLMSEIVGLRIMCEKCIEAFVNMGL